MANRIQSLSLAAYDRRTGAILIAGRDVDIIRPNDCVEMADGGELSESVDSLPHRPEGFSASRKVHMLLRVEPKEELAHEANEEDLELLKSGNKAALHARLAELLGAK